MKLPQLLILGLLAGLPFVGDTAAQKKQPDDKPAAAEADYYKMTTVPTPKDIVLEVGGLQFRPDGKLLACTRRGDVWLVGNPDSEDAAKVTWKKYATGLHEALGLRVDGKDV